MKLKDIISDSVFSTIATITGPESLDKAELFLGANEELIKQFPLIYLHVNCLPDVDTNLVFSYMCMWSETFPYKVLCSDYKKNRGHMFGTIDLDEACLTSAEKSKFKYLWKSTEDVITYPGLISVEVKEDFDFAYLPGFSYEVLLNAGSTANLIRDYEEKFYAPQTNFFILKTDKVKNLYGYDVEEKRKAYEAVKESYPLIKPWHMQFPDGVKFGLEDHLGRTTKGLNKQMLLSEASFRNLIDHVKYHAEPDPSHKNLLLKEIGVCHYHNWQDRVFEID